MLFRSGDPSITLTSADGLNWTYRPLPANGSWSGLAYGNGALVTLRGLSGSAAVASESLGSFSNVSGATSSSLALSGLTASNTGDQYRAVVSAANASSVTSSPATLTVP